MRTGQKRHKMAQNVPRWGGGQGLAPSLGALLGWVFVRRETAQALGPHPTPFSAILGPFRAILGLFWLRSTLTKDYLWPFLRLSRIQRCANWPKKGPKWRRGVGWGPRACAVSRSPPGVGIRAERDGTSPWPPPHPHLGPSGPVLGHFGPLGA